MPLMSSLTFWPLQVANLFTTNALKIGLYTVPLTLGTVFGGVLHCFHPVVEADQLLPDGLCCSTDYLHGAFVDSRTGRREESSGICLSLWHRRRTM